MAVLRVEWEAGAEEFEIDDQTFEEYQESGVDIEYFFDTYISDVWPEKYAIILDD